MDRLVMVDCRTTTDDRGNPIGHGIKVANEYGDLLIDDFQLRYYLNAEVESFCRSNDVCVIGKSPEKVSDKFKKLVAYYKAIKYVYREERNSNVWFYVPDFYIYLFLLLIPKGKRHISVTVYEDFCNSRIKHFVFDRLMKKIDLAIVTNQYYNNCASNTVEITDFIYSDDRYRAYNKDHKKDLVVCLGTMNVKKKLHEAVKVFAQNGYSLLIAGQFTDKKMYDQLMAEKTDNIIIEDRYIDENEYYAILGEAKYSLIPYDAEFYKNRTSGVIQESAFVGAIPITCQSILDFSGLRGVGYESINDLQLPDEAECHDISEFNNRVVDLHYDYRSVQKKLVEAFKGICEGIDYEY